MSIILTNAQIDNYAANFLTYSSWSAYTNSATALSVANFAQLDGISLNNFLYAIGNKLIGKAANSVSVDIFRRLIVSMTDAQLDSLLVMPRANVPRSIPKYVSNFGGLLLWVTDLTSLYSDTRFMSRLLKLDFSLGAIGLMDFNASTTALSQSLSITQLQSLNTDQLVSYLKPWLDNINLPANASTKTKRMGFLKTLAWDNLTFFQRADLLRYYTVPLGATASSTLSFMDQLRPFMIGGATLSNANPLDPIIILDVKVLNEAKPANRYAALENCVKMCFIRH